MQAVHKDNWAHRLESRCCDRCISFVPKKAYNENKKGNYEEKLSVVGRCRRHSPTHEGYPVVLDSDWCGDFKLNEY